MAAQVWTEVTYHDHADDAKGLLQDVKALPAQPTTIDWSHVSPVDDVSLVESRRARQSPRVT
jgi:hypothetical protein